MKPLYIYYAVIIFLTMIACGAEKESAIVEVNTDNNSSGITITAAQFSASQMEDGKLEAKQFDKHITVNGKIHLPNKSKAIVSSMVSGTVGEIDLVEGQWVKRGQILFSVFNPELIDLQQEYLVLQSKMNYLQSEQQRKQQLVDEDLGAKQELLLAQSAYQTNQAMFQAIAQKLEMYGISTVGISSNSLKSSLQISAPISGYVSAIGAIRGQYISPATEVVYLNSPAHSHLELNVLERDAFSIKKGQKIQFQVQGVPEKLYHATVHLINSSVNENGLIKIHCHMEQGNTLLPGMYATADIKLQSYDVLAIPEEAILIIEDKENVLILEEKTDNTIVYQPYQVEVGGHKDGFIEIKNPGEISEKTILIKGGYYIVN